MARKKTDQRWVLKVNTFAAQDDAYGARTITDMLAGISPSAWPKDDANVPIPPPLERTVGTILAEFRALKERERAVFGAYSWPASHVDELVPWEASRIGLDLWRDHRRVGADPPTVLRVLWNWRLSLASPSLDPSRRDLEVLSILSPSEKTMTRMQQRLAFEPWRGALERKRYDDLFPDDRQELSDATSE